MRWAREKTGRRDNAWLSESRPGIEEMRIQKMSYESAETYALGYAGVHQKAPDASGVYTIYSSARWIYVGESDDIQRSLFRHLNDPTPCMERFGPLSFSFELVHEGERMVRWHALVAELEPACNHPSAKREQVRLAADESKLLRRGTGMFN
jgi:hypothetical protein